MTREDFYKKWDKKTLESQDASNVYPLLTMIEKMLKDWRTIDNHEWNGRDSENIRLVLYQIAYLMGREVFDLLDIKGYINIQDRLLGKGVTHV